MVQRVPKEAVVCFPSEAGSTALAADAAPQAHWAVAHAWSGREHRIRPEIEKTNCGTFLPTYASVTAKDGKLSVRERVQFPGYVFFQVEGDSWGGVATVDGVFRVLGSDGKAGLVTEDEMQRVVLGHALGWHNQVELAGLDPDKDSGKRRSCRRRRPRPGRRLRAARAAV